MRTPVTVEALPNVPVITLRGRMSFARWARREADRIAEDGVPTFIRKNGGDRIALFRGQPLPTDKVLYVSELI